MLVLGFGWSGVAKMASDGLWCIAAVALLLVAAATTVDARRHIQFYTPSESRHWLQYYSPFGAKECVRKLLFVCLTCAGRHSPAVGVASPGPGSDSLSHRQRVFQA